MTPPARLQAAIGVLDQYLSGMPLEKALTNWARGSRYAGSKDRAAVRDIVFQSVRCRASYAARGGSATGRGLAIGYVVANGHDVDTLFEGSGYGPDALSSDEKGLLKNRGLADDLHVSLDMPKWLMPLLERAIADDLAEVFATMQTRAPVYVRVNTSKVSRDEAVALLASDGISASPITLSKTALMVTENPRKINNCKVLQDGLIELQDAASQAVCESVPMGEGVRVLDYCAGGGGKSLAFADRPHGQIFAHDINASRMSDIPHRAARAGVRIKILTKPEVSKNGPFDVVFCDVPCSGSGAWRRSPEGKWAFTPEKLEDLTKIQNEILREASKLVTPDGLLAYATCSLLCEENEDQVAQFLAENAEWTAGSSRRFSPLEGGDGFFVAHLTRKT